MCERIGLAPKAVLFVPVACLFGCVSHPALKSDYVEFSRKYGEASDKQLLLNLARLANDDPVYFIQLGSFSSQYQFGASAGFSPSYVHNSPSFYQSSTSKTTGGTPPTGGSTVASGVSTFFHNVLTLGGSANATVTETPIFQFLPLTGSNLVSTVLTPITDRVFYTFYDQGYPADLVARTMIATVKHEIPQISGTSVVATNVEYLVNNPYDVSYPKFLMFCSALRQAQLAHTLTVSPKKGSDVLVYSNTSAKLSEIVTSIQANLSVKYDVTNGGRLTVSQPDKGISFIANTNVHLQDPERLFRSALRIVAPRQIADPAVFVADTQAGANDLSNAVALASEFAQDRYTPQMRTVEASLYTVAREENYFRGLIQARSRTNGLFGTKSSTRIKGGKEAPYPDVLFGWDEYGPYAIVNRTNIMFSIDEIKDPAALVGKIQTNSAPIYRLLNQQIGRKAAWPRNEQTLAAAALPSVTQQIVDALNDLTSHLTMSNNATFRDVHQHPDTPIIESTNPQSDETQEFNRVLLTTALSSDLKLSEFKVRPLMKLTQQAGERPPDRLVTDISYGNGQSQTYFVGDPEGVHQNRTVFTMLSYLVDQAAISTQNLPVQQLIQVH